MKIQVIGLVTGEQLIAKTEEQENGVLLKNAAILLPAGKGELGMAPWIPYCETENGVLVDSKAIAWHVAAKTDLANHYNSAFGNGLVVPVQQEVVAPELKLVEG
jgi:hypothetical protein